MSRLELVLVVALATYGTRIAGFMLGRRGIPASLSSFLEYVPVAVFAALVAPDLGLGGSDALPRLIGAGAAALAVLRLRQLWAGLAGGMAAYWLARALLAALHGGVLP